MRTESYTDAQVHYVLALDLAEGVTQESNKREAIKHLKKAIHLGHVSAKYVLGHFYLNGIGFRRKNYRRAVRLFKECAEAGISDAMCELAFCFSNGLGVAKNNKKAFMLYRSAAEDGIEEAVFNTALFLEYGVGCEKDIVLARQYYVRVRSRYGKEVEEALKRLDSGQLRNG
jgi:TPR repeat protein